MTGSSRGAASGGPPGLGPWALRPGTPDDALCLGVLASQVWLEAYATEGIRPAIAREVLQGFSTQRLAALLQQAQTFFILAGSGPLLLGFAQVTLGTPIAQVPGDAPAELDRLYVMQRFTGQGIGAALLHAAESHAAARGAQRLWLTPWVHNTRAIRFYGREGYADLGQTVFELDGEAHVNRVMAKALGPARP